MPDLEMNRLPVDPTTGRPLPPRAQPGYYPGYNTLALQSFWDEATREVVVKRVNDPPPLRFFQGDVLRLMQAVLDRILPQNDRDQAHRIPMINAIDERLYTKRMSGYRYEDMPPDDEAFRLGLRAIEAIAQHLFGHAFVDLEPLDQDMVLKTIHDGDPPAGQEIWDHMPVHHFWTILVQDAVEAYYAHPYAWDEIGYGGPAYPRGYMRLERGEPEPWEVDEERYAWAPPPNALSGIDAPIGGHEGLAPLGQGGTH
jgi:hypothetical protein